MKTLITLFGKNPWFFIPFLLWVVTGGVLQIFFFTHEELFLAINHAHAPWADVLMTGVTYIGDGITFAIMLAIILLLRKFRLFFNAAAILLLVTIIVQTAKHIFNAPRPISYFGDASLIHTVKWVTVHSSCSFPSGHTTTAFAMFCFLALISKNKLTGALFITMGLIAAWSRIYLAQHFFIDVYVGSIIGTLSSVFIYMLFEQRKIKSSPEIVQEPLVGLS
ncbi:Membrane-associated phospholipid phosphatase [Chitinophaga sp. YR573]|uniref:phosphatase PAP2 family protein n=1 Tax=Chitinophaga sp. YR573 TaxID=1881040 RepID=UPI0008C57A54|nr:phosphatase PAP2 family protein [Chitinophaga sp. YR573]SEW16870.1 Membrane-associated phospholipid phosphatase [Chitinophaga sp. YR573]